MMSITKIALVAIARLQFLEAAEENVGLVLLQIHAELMSGVGPGSTIPLTEQGYQYLVTLKSDEETESFVHRLVAAEARYVVGAGELKGVVPFYSGSQGTQSLEALKVELRKAPWVAKGEGRTAPLTEAGYQKVAKLQSQPHMISFIRRILDDDEKEVTDEGMLKGVVPFYDGEQAVQSFDQLKTELNSASWVVPKGGRPTLSTLETTSRYVWGSHAALSDVGYQEVAALHDDAEMKSFIVRVLDQHGLTVKAEGGEADLDGFTPWFSGNLAVQNFAQLKQQLLSAPWTSKKKKDSSPIVDEPNNNDKTSKPKAKKEAEMTKEVSPIVNEAKHNDKTSKPNAAKDAEKKKEATKEAEKLRTDDDLQQSVQKNPEDMAVEKRAQKLMKHKARKERRERSKQKRKEHSFAEEDKEEDENDGEGEEDDVEVDESLPHKASENSSAPRRRSLAQGKTECAGWCYNTDYDHYPVEVKCIWQGCGACSGCDDADVQVAMAKELRMRARRHELGDVLSTGMLVGEVSVATSCSEWCSSSAYVEWPEEVKCRYAECNACSTCSEPIVQTKIAKEEKRKEHKHDVEVRQ